MFNKSDYQVIFKAKKKILNLFSITKKYYIFLDVDGLEDTDSTSEIKKVIQTYADQKKLSDVKLVSYTRYIHN